MTKPHVDNSASGRTIALGNGPVYEPPPASICTAPGLMAAGRSEQAPTAGTLAMSRTNGYARRSRRTERPPLSRVATGYYRHVPGPGGRRRIRRSRMEQVEQVEQVRRHEIAGGAYPPRVSGMQTRMRPAHRLVYSVSGSFPCGRGRCPGCSPRTSREARAASRTSSFSS